MSSLVAAALHHVMAGIDTSVGDGVAMQVLRASVCAMSIGGYGSSFD